MRPQLLQSHQEEKYDLIYYVDRVNVYGYSGSCPFKLDGEMLPSRTAFQPNQS